MAEFFQNVWSLLTTENAEIIKYLISPFTFVESLVTILFFTTILKIKNTKINIKIKITNLFIINHHLYK